LACSSSCCVAAMASAIWADSLLEMRCCSRLRLCCFTSSSCVSLSLAADSSLAGNYHTCHAQGYATGTSPGFGCCSVVLAHCIACCILVGANCFALLATAALCPQIIGYTCGVDCSAFVWPWYGNSLCNTTRQVSSVRDSNCIEVGST